jgi:hypothetical protein
VTKQVLSQLNCLRDRMGRLITIWVDGGYRGKDFTHWVIDVYQWIWSVVTRHIMSGKSLTIKLRF